jgi:hypothetical protein
MALLCVADVSQGGAYTCTMQSVGLTTNIANSAEAIYEDVGGEHYGQYSAIHQPIPFTETQAQGTAAYGQSTGMLTVDKFANTPITMLAPYNGKQVQWAIPTTPIGTNGALHICYGQSTC